MPIATITPPQNRHVYARLGAESILVRPLRRDEEPLLCELSELVVRGPSTASSGAVAGFALVALSDTELGGREGAPVGVARLERGSLADRTATASVIVAEQVRGRGIGGVLVRELVRESLDRGIDRLRVGARPDHPAVVRLVARYGRLKLRPGGVVDVWLHAPRDGALDAAGPLLLADEALRASGVRQPH